MAENKEKAAALNILQYWCTRETRGNDVPTMIYENGLRGVNADLVIYQHAGVYEDDRLVALVTAAAELAGGLTCALVRYLWYDKKRALVSVDVDGCFALHDVSAEAKNVDGLEFEALSAEDADDISMLGYRVKTPLPGVVAVYRKREPDETVLEAILTNELVAAGQALNNLMRFADQNIDRAAQVILALEWVSEITYNANTIDQNFIIE